MERATRYGGRKDQYLRVAQRLGVLGENHSFNDEDRFIGDFVAECKEQIDCSVVGSFVRTSHASFYSKFVCYKDRNQQIKEARFGYFEEGRTTTGSTAVREMREELLEGMCKFHGYE
jgi:hypothetical protein